MEITAKGRYAVRVVADIARLDGEYVSLSDIAKRQDLSLKYLERIISMLVKAGIVESMRGANGGYRLARDMQEISIQMILDATGDSVKIATCVHGENCPKADKCDTIGVWNTLNELICDYLSSVTIKDLLKQTCERKLIKNID